MDQTLRVIIQYEIMNGALSPKLVHEKVVKAFGDNAASYSRVYAAFQRFRMGNDGDHKDEPAQKKFIPVQDLQEYIRTHPDATSHEISQVFQCTSHYVTRRLNAAGMERKNKKWVPVNKAVSPADVQNAGVQMLPQIAPVPVLQPEPEFPFSFGMIPAGQIARVVIPDPQVVPNSDWCGLSFLKTEENAVNGWNVVSENGCPH